MHVILPVETALSTLLLYSFHNLIYSGLFQLEKLYKMLLMIIRQ